MQMHSVMYPLLQYNTESFQGPKNSVLQLFNLLASPLNPLQPLTFLLPVVLPFSEYDLIGVIHYVCMYVFSSMYVFILYIFRLVSITYTMHLKFIHLFGDLIAE